MDLDPCHNLDSDPSGDSVYFHTSILLPDVHDELPKRLKFEPLISKENVINFFISLLKAEKSVQFNRIKGVGFKLWTWKNLLAYYIYIYKKREKEIERKNIKCTEYTKY